MRTRFVQGIGGTLRFDPPEVSADGAVPTVATVTVKRASGIDLPTPVVDATATIDAEEGTLSVALAGAQCQDPYALGEHLYRATWRYTIGGVVYETDQLFEVRRRVLKPTLTFGEVEGDLPAPVADLVAGGVTEITDAMAEAWDDLLDELAAKGYEPDKVMNADRLRRPHREWTIARLARAWGPTWRQYAIDREAAYQRTFDKALEAGDWYDRSGDALQSASTETETKPHTIVLTR